MVHSTKKLDLEEDAQHTNERIGKKYQWLALHELLARVADNFEKLEYSWSDNVVEYEGTWEPTPFVILIQQLLLE